MGIPHSRLFPNKSLALKKSIANRIAYLLSNMQSNVKQIIEVSSYKNLERSGSVKILTGT